MQCKTPRGIPDNRNNLSYIHSSYTCSSKTQQRARSQSSYKIDGHESTRCLAFSVFNVLACAHHAAAAEPTVRAAEAELDDEQVEGIAVDLRTVALDVAEQIQGEETNAKDCQDEEHDGSVAHGEGEEGDESTHEITQVPNQEAKGDESC